ncbi:MAG: hypothetical protein R2794_04125 [Chitinophagales bacterium]
MYQQEFNSIIKDKNRLLEFDGTLIRNIAETVSACQPVQALYTKEIASQWPVRWHESTAQDRCHGF